MMGSSWRERVALNAACVAAVFAFVLGAPDAAFPAVTAGADADAGVGIGSEAAAEPGDAAGPVTLLVNAHVFTAEYGAPYAEAVALRGERILAVGSLASVEKAAGASARRIDLGGKFLMPGMIDAHAHPVGSRLVLGGGFTLITANFPDSGGSIPDLERFVGKTMDEGTSRIGDVIFIGTIDIGYWRHAAEIDAALSSGRFANVPIALIGSDGHTAWGNRLLRQRAGITAKYLRGLTPAERAYYGFGREFNPNGFVVDVGLTRLRQSLPAPSQAFMLSAGEAGVKHLNSLGITGWLDAAAAGVVGGDVPLKADESGPLQVYREMSRRGELTAHVAAYPVIRPASGLAQLDVVESLRREFSGVPNLTVPGLKVFADGVVEFPSQTAALTQPFRNSGRSSPLLFDPGKFNALVVEADRRGLIVHIHAIGDLAVKASLDAFGAARDANPRSTLPHTLTHAQFVDVEDVPRFAQYQVIAALQLLWAVADPSTNEEIKPYIDPAIHARMYPARSLLEAGAVIAGASDWPVSSANPFEAMAQAETRTGPQGVLDAGQRMPREAMLYAYTRHSARVLNQLDAIGSIAPGKRADLVLVDRDVLTEPVDRMREAKVVWTMFGGRIVYGTAPWASP
jgi:predicted amidohydrolase YtcJ